MMPWNTHVMPSAKLPGVELTGIFWQQGHTCDALTVEDERGAWPARLNYGDQRQESGTQQKLATQIYGSGSRRGLHLRQGDPEIHVHDVHVHALQHELLVDAACSRRESLRGGRY